MAEWMWVVALALLVPLTVVVGWFIQRKVVEVLEIQNQRARLRNRYLSNAAAWLGTFIHELSHAIVLLFGGHGIRSMEVKPGQGAVQPKRIRDGWLGFTSFLLAALAPFYIPPLVWGASLLLLTSAKFPIVGKLADLSSMLDTMSSILDFTVVVLKEFIRLDLASWQGLVILAVLIVTGPASKPSLVKQSKYHADNQGDLAVVSKMLRKHKSWAFILIVICLLPGISLAFYPPIFWNLYGFIWAMIVLGILSATILTTFWFGLALARKSKAPLPQLIPLVSLGVGVFVHYGGIAPILANLITIATFWVMVGIARAFPKYRLPPN